MLKVSIKKFIITSTWLFLLPGILLGTIDLNQMSQEFVLEKVQIKIPDYPLAYNPSIVRWRDSILMSFRILTNANNVWHSQIGLVWVDENFQPISKPKLLDTRARCPLHPSKSEDARLFTVNDRLYIIYNDNEEFYDEGLRRMYYSEVFYNGREFFVYPECLHTYEGARPDKWEKNWVPFDYNGTFLLAYSISPHRIFLPLFGLGACQTVSSTRSVFSWAWGMNRLFGGTPALKVGDQYLAFFHSSKQLNSVQSNDYHTWHYFLGAYTFNPDPPFAITHVSPFPIIGKGLYDNPLIYKRVIFPGGYVFDENYIWIAYGREDSEAWILKLDRKGLLNSLSPVVDILYE